MHINISPPRNLLVINWLLYNFRSRKDNIGRTDTTEKFIGGVVDTGVQFFGSVVDTGDKF
jgi:hypothetical protein